MKVLKIFLLLLLICSTGFCSVDFNGDADYINVGQDTSFNLQTLTISAWIKIPTSPNGSNPILTHGNGNWVLRTESTPVMQFLDSHQSLIGTSDTTITKNVWVHCLVTTSENGASDEFNFYLNGDADGSGIYNRDLTSGGTQDALIMADYGASLDEWGNSAISDVALWNVVLTTQEIAILGKSRVKGMPLQIQPDKLVGYWPLDDFSDGTALNTDAGGYKDRSGNGNDGQGVDADNDSTNIAEEVLSYP